ncbi:MAG TPA: Ku protein [Candidatus Acidoferrum sp.]
MAGLTKLVAAEADMAASVWKGSISFGLVSVPIKLFAAARYTHISFHEVHRECGHRVQHQLYCPYDKRVVSRDEIVMGYEVDEDKTVIVDREELKKLQPASSSSMEILQFVKLSDVDPIYFETSYFSVPDEAGQRGYTLLLETMEELQMAAIARVTMHQRERTVILRPYDGGLTLHTLYYPNEIRDVKGYGKNKAANLKKPEIELAEQFAEGLVAPFRPGEFHDEYQERVKKLIESKEKGTAAPKPEKAPKLAPVVDLMTALKQSIANKGGHGNSHRTEPSRAGRARKTA